MTDDNPQAVPPITISHSTALVAYHALQQAISRWFEPENREEIEGALSELGLLIEKKPATTCVYCGNETVNTFPSQVPLCAWHETPDMFL